MELFGGYNIFPNIDKISKNGTVSNAIACFACTLLCHTVEWTGKNVRELHNELDTSHNHDLIDVHLVLCTSLISIFLALADKYYLFLIT
jgi:hypothetical protein